MEHAGLFHISNTIESIKPAKFLSCVDKYAKASSAVDQLLRDRSPIPDHITKHYDSSFETCVKESKSLLSLLTMALKHLMDYRCYPNSEWKTSTDLDGKTFRYVQQMKWRQMSKVADISDHIEIILNTMKQSRRFRSVVLHPSETIRSAAHLMGILHERLVNRPTAVIRIDHRSDEKIQELNNTINAMNSYENQYCSPFAFEMRTQPAAAAYAEYYDLTQTSMKDIDIRTQQLSSGINELKQDLHLFKKLITKGYSDRMAKRLDSAVSDYLHRKEAFQAVINDFRRQFIS